MLRHILQLKIRSFISTKRDLDYISKEIILTSDAFKRRAHLGLLEPHICQLCQWNLHFNEFRQINHDKAGQTSMLSLRKSHMVGANLSEDAESIVNEYVTP